MAKMERTRECLALFIHFTVFHVLARYCCRRWRLLTGKFVLLRVVISKLAPSLVYIEAKLLEAVTKKMGLSPQATAPRRLWPRGER